MKKLLCLLIAAIIVLSAVASCAAPADSNRDTDGANEPAGDLVGENGAPSEDANEPEDSETDDSETDDSETTAGDTETESTPDTETDVSDTPHEDAFTVENFDGYAFKILTNTQSSSNVTDCMNDFDEPSEHLCDNAIYERNKAVEEALNVTISETTISGDYPMFTTLRDASLAGYHECDIYFISMLMGLNATEVGINGNVDDFIDLENSWWNAACTEQLAIHGQHRMASGDIALSDREGIWTVEFNKNLIDRFGLESPYDLVASGEWTWDKMMEMSTYAFSVDNEAGRYLSCHRDVAAALNSAGKRLVTLNESGSPYVSFGTDSFTTVYEAVNAMIESSATYHASTMGTSVDFFKIEEGLFVSCPVFFIGGMRESDADFGIVPYPKYDLAATDYLSHVSPYSQVMSFLNTAYEHSYDIGIITEALAAKGAEIITPAYYDVLLTSASGRDEQSATMLDLIFEQRLYDLGVFADYEMVYSDLIKRSAAPSELYNKSSAAISQELQGDFDHLRP